MTDIGSADTTNAARIREIFRKLFDERDLSDPSKYWSEESVDHFQPLGATVRGPEELKAWFEAQFAAIPDWRMKIENVVDDGAGQVVVQWTAHGTFSGAPWVGLQPTGRRVIFYGCDVVKMAPDGRIGTLIAYFDGAAFARQVGMLPPAGSAGDRVVTKAFNGLTRLRRLIGGSKGKQAGPWEPPPVTNHTATAA